MKIEIFTAHGETEIKGLADRVNRWIAENVKGVVSITPSLCSVGSEGQGEFWQFMTITVVYN